MLSFQSIARQPALLFGSALLSLVLGLGLFFDHLSDTNDVRHLARWAVDSHDHGGLPFAVLDKAQGRLFAFDAQGQLRGSAAVPSSTLHDSFAEVAPEFLRVVYVLPEQAPLRDRRPL